MDRRGFLASLLGLPLVRKLPFVTCWQGSDDGLNWNRLAVFTKDSGLRAFEDTITDHKVVAQMFAAFVNLDARQTGELFENGSTIAE